MKKEHEGINKALELFKSVRRIEIKTSKMVNSYFAGSYHSVFKGCGIEFDEVREYATEDDIRAIDWKVSARYNKLYTKRFREERELTVIIMADMSASNNFSSSIKLKKDLIAELTALFAFSAMKNNDKVGLVLFTDGIEKFIPPRKGRNHILRIVRETVDYEPKGVKTDVQNAFIYLNKIQKRHAVIFLLTDLFSDIPKKEVEMAAKKHDIITCIVEDERETEIPKVGIVALSDPETNEMIYLDTNKKSVRKTYLKKMTDYIEKKILFLKQHKIDGIRVSTNSDYTKEVVRFFRNREKRRK